MSNFLISISACLVFIIGLIVVKIRYPWYGSFQLDGLEETPAKSIAACSTADASDLIDLYPGKIVGMPAVPDLDSNNVFPFLEAHLNWCEHQASCVEQWAGQNAYFREAADEVRHQIDRLSGGAA